MPLLRRDPGASAVTPMVALFWYGVVPNVVWAVAGTVVFVSRPMVCVDYLVAGSSAAVLPRWATLALVAAVLAADALTSLGGIYYFLGADLLSALQYLSALAWAPLLAFAWPGRVAGLAYLVATARLIHLDDTRSHRTAMTLLLAAGLLTGIDTVNGTNTLVHSGDVRVAANIAGSALVLVGRLAASSPALAHATPVPAPSATADLRAFLTDASGRADGHILVVVVESWGVPQSPLTHDTLIAPLLSANVRADYTVRTGTLESRGATVSAELRELCGVRAAGVAAAPSQAAAWRSCLPWLAREKGYTTAAYHGFSGAMFNRTLWYPVIGFQQAAFAETVRSRAQATRSCGQLFSGGLCDRDVLLALERDLLEARQPQFLYWLTLESHLPVDPQEATGAAPCDTLGSDAPGVGVCRSMTVVARTLSQIASLATDSRFALSWIVVVGDHPPPFAARRDRAWFESNRVPFVELRRRAAFLPIHD